MSEGRRAATVVAPPTSVHIGRQPVYDAHGHLYGFELLFRAAADRTAAGVTDGDAATSSTILAAFAEFDVTELLGTGYAFVNLTRAFLVGDLPVPFPPDRCVLEVLEDITVDTEVVDGARRLADAGYRLALDDFTWHEDARPLLELADIVKVDVLALPWGEVLDVVERCRPYGVRLLAERVEDQDVLERCRDAGFELFQGYHLGRPQVLTADALTPGHALALQLVARLGDPSASAADVESLLREDPALTIRLLRIANSAQHGQTRRLSSVRDAVVLVGLTKLRAWLVLMSLSGLGGQGIDERLADALVLARTCEVLAHADPRVPGDVAFTLGLLHGIAEALAMPASRLLAGLPPLADDLARGLTADTADLTPSGRRLRHLLEGVLGYLAHDLSAVAASGLDAGGVQQAYLEALAWTSRTCGELTGGRTSPR